MTPEHQRWWALALVALAVAGLLVRAWRSRRRPGCGGDCGCGAQSWRRR